jgi:putative ABC transport system permease protein
VLAEALALCAIGALAGMLLASLVTSSLPPDFPPLATDRRVWLVAAVAATVLAAAVGLPPAVRAMRLRIVDALAGR